MTLFHSLTAATHAPSLGNSISSVTRRALEGQHLWGNVDVTPAGRTSWSRTRLTVYPPGTNAAERRALQLHRTWPVAGAVVALVILLALSTWPTLLATVVAAGIYTAGIVVGLAATRTLRPRVRRLTLMVVSTCGGLETSGDIGFFTQASENLRQLDDLLREGGMGPAEYERQWGRIYDALPSASDRAH